MRTGGRLLAILMVLLGLQLLDLGLPCQASAARPYQRDRHGQYVSTTPWDLRNEFVGEVGAVIPEGDLGDDFFGTDKGLGADTGYAFGVRYRYYLDPHTAVSPAIHYANFGNFEGVTDVDGTEHGFKIDTQTFRYGIDLQRFFGEPDAQIQAFLSAGVGLYHNRYRDELSGFADFKTSSNNIGFEAGGGLRLGPVELGGYYDFNRTKSENLPSESGGTKYNWDHIAVRAGVSLGRF